jgi:hypothetical protein
LPEREKEKEDNLEFPRKEDYRKFPPKRGLSVSPEKEDYLVVSSPRRREAYPFLPKEDNLNFPPKRGLPLSPEKEDYLEFSLEEGFLSIELAGHEVHKVGVGHDEGDIRLP